MPSAFNPHRAGARGRGRGRGRGRARGRAGRGRFDSRPKAVAPAAPPEPDDDGASSEAVSSDSEREGELEDGDDDDGDGDDDELDQAAKPYNQLLASLTAAAKPPKPSRKAKRRKLEHVVTEEVASDAAEEEEGAEEDEVEKEEVKAVEEEEEDENPADPFETHFAAPSAEFLARIQKAKENKWETTRTELPNLGRAVISVPAGGERTRSSELHLKKKLQDGANKWTSLQKALGKEVFSYSDLLYTQRTVENAGELRQLYALHALNHVFKTRDKVLKNNARLSGKEDGEIELRDQGFTRPKVLILLPTRNSCVKVVEAISGCLQVEQQENKKRFEDTFLLPPSADALQSSNKPADFLDLFSGNHDDAFRLGLKLTRKTLKFFSAFYNSDMILASPLGLRLAIGDPADKKKPYDSDFLSSIEVVILDQADALLQQNWEHVEHIFSHLNLLPKDPHGCDIGRVREWYLDTHARFLRQTLVFSAFLTPELNALLSSVCANIGGKVKTQPVHAGIIDSLALPVKHVFTRFASSSASSPTSDPDDRFAYFTSALVPALLRSPGGVLLVVPSYLDFVRVRNHLLTLDLAFGAVSEETPVKEVARARSHFMNGRHKVLLYTCRAHHFRRYELRGVKEVLMLKVPDNPAFYAEMAGMVGSGGDGGGGGGGREAGRGRVRVAFSRWDAVALERIVGTRRVGTLMRDVGDTFEFV